MSSTLSHLVRVPRPMLSVVLGLFAIVPMLIQAEFQSVAAAALAQRETQKKPAVQTSPKAAGRSAIGEWRSREQVDNQPRATIVVHEDAGTLAGSLTLLGMTRGADDRATLGVSFRGAGWDGTTLTFETVLPDNEGTSRWALRLVKTGRATLCPTGDDGKPVEDGPMWEMVRQ